MQSWRNIFYSSRENKVILWTWNDEGKRIKVETSYEPYLYIESKNHQDAVSIFNTSLKKLTFKNQFERSKFGYINVCCKNASHKVWNKSGRYFRTFQEALENYKSSEMKAIISTVEGA